MTAKGKTWLGVIISYPLLLDNAWPLPAVAETAGDWVL